LSDYPSIHPLVVARIVQAKAVDQDFPPALANYAMTILENNADGERVRMQLFQRAADAGLVKVSALHCSALSLWVYRVCCCALVSGRNR
jgi:hypothetical protein